jgi:hypothetical protein
MRDDETLGQVVLAHGSGAYVARSEIVAIGPVERAREDAHGNSIAARTLYLRGGHTFLVADRQELMGWLLAREPR